MKKHKTIKRLVCLLLLISLGGVFLKGCVSSGNKIKAAEGEVVAAVKDLNTAEEDFRNDVKLFRKQSEQKISNNEVTIAGFNFKLANEMVSNKNVYQQKTNDLDNRNKDLKKRLNDYKGDEVITFAPFKKEFNKDMDALVKAIDAFAMQGKVYVTIQ